MAKSAQTLKQKVRYWVANLGLINPARKFTHAVHRLNIKSALAAKSRAGSNPATSPM